MDTLLPSAMRSSPDKRTGRRSTVRFPNPAKAPDTSRETHLERALCSSRYSPAKAFPTSLRIITRSPIGRQLQNPLHTSNPSHLRQASRWLQSSVSVGGANRWQ